MIYFWQYIFTKTTWNIPAIQARNSLIYTLAKIFFLKFRTIVLPSIAPQIFLATNLCLLLHITLILNITFVYFSSSLSKLNVSSTCYELIPIEIAQIFQALLNEVYSSDNHYFIVSLTKVTPFKEGTDLALKIQNTLLIDWKVNKWKELKVKGKTSNTFDHTTRPLSVNK